MAFLRLKRERRLLKQEAANEIIRYDAFIVAPTPRMDSEEYKDLMELYREITETLFPAPIERKANNPKTWKNVLNPAVKSKTYRIHEAVLSHSRTSCTNRESGAGLTGMSLT